MSKPDLNHLVAWERDTQLQMWRVFISTPELDETVGYFETWIEAIGAQLSTIQTLELMVQGKLATINRRN